MLVETLRRPDERERVSDPLSLVGDKPEDGLEHADGEREGDGRPEGDRAGQTTRPVP